MVRGIAQSSGNMYKEWIKSEVSPQSAVGTQQMNQFYKR